MRKIEKIILIFLSLVFLYSTFNVGRVFAASNILKITNAVVTEKSTEVDASVLDYSNNTISSNVSFHRLNDFVVYKVTVKNTDSIKHIIDIVVDNNSKDYLEYEYDDYKNTILEPGQEVDVYIKEIYRNSINSTSNRSQSNTVKFTFNLIDEVKNESVIDVIVNPKTGDNIYIHVGLAFVSLVALLLIMLKRSKHNKKTSVLMLLLPIAFLSLPIVTRALDSKDEIVINNTVNLYDKIAVTYRINNVDNEVVVNYGKKVKEPAAPSQAGYDFDGWFKDGEPYDFSLPVKEDMVLVGKLSRTTYNITYSLNGGRVRNPNTYKITELPISINNPTKEGYDFKGWTGSNGDVPDDELVINTDSSSDLTFSANYDLTEYKINYLGLSSAEKAALNNPATYTMSSNITLTNPTNRYDSNNEISSRFVGWRDEKGDLSTNISFSNSTGDKTYEAIWQRIKPDTFFITYNLNGGTLSGEENPTSFKSSTATFTLINPTKEGYDFKGWIGSNGNVPQTVVKVEKGTVTNLNFEAVFEEIEYNIDYDLHGGSANNPETYTINQSVTLVAPSKEGYTFTGWTGTDLSGLTMNVTIPVNSTGDRSYEAHYEVIDYDITYTLNGGNVSGNPITYTVEDLPITLNNPTKEGFTFDGWTGSNGTDPSVSLTIENVTGDLEYEANFTPNPYTVHFDKNDSSATGTMSDQTFAYGEEKTLTKNAFTKTGYAFDGWTTNPDGTGTGFDDEELVSDLIQTGTITLYANWRRVTTATFQTGKSVDILMKTLSGYSSPRESTVDTRIKKVLYYEGTVPQAYRTEANIASVSTSEEEIYMWYENDNIYYGSDADVLYTNKDSSYMFYTLQKVTHIDTHFKTDNATNLAYFLWGDHSLETMDVSHFNTSQVTNMTSLFGETYVLNPISVENWNVSKVKLFNHMFNQAKAVTTLDLSRWNTSSAENMRNMFSSTFSLTTLKVDNFNTSKVTDMQAMFNDSPLIKKIDLRSFDVRNVSTFARMFKNDTSLEEIDFSSFELSTSKNITMDTMFLNVSGMKVLDISSFNTQRVTVFSNMFTDMTSLETIYVGSGWTTSGLTSTPVMFGNTPNLVGGAGTAWTSSNTKSTYAHIDGGLNNPGYFTSK